MGPAHRLKCHRRILTQTRSDTLRLATEWGQRGPARALFRAPTRVSSATVNICGI